MTLTLIKTSELADRLSRNPEAVCLVDARKEDEYSSAHISSAINLLWHHFCKSAPDDVPDVYKQPGWWGAVDCTKELENYRLPVNLDKHIIVYGDGAGTKGRDGFLVSILRYLGAENISILDGGWTQWISEGRNKTERISDTTYNDSRRVRSQEDLFTTVEELKANLESDRAPLLLDARSKREFTGKYINHLNPNGHIAGACLFEYASLYEANSTRFLSKNAYLELPEVETILKSKNPVAYCEMGLRAATLAVLHEIHTGQKVKLLNGGIFSWTLEKKNPIESKT